MDDVLTLWLFTTSSRPAEQRIAKTVRKPQSTMQLPLRPRSPSHEPDFGGDTDIDNPFQDSDVVLDGPADGYPTDASENDPEPMEPSQTLLDSLERFSSSVARLHKMRRLPFLCRNLRRGFQLHCQIVGVDTKPHPLPRTSISVVYSCPIVGSPSSGSGENHIATAKGSMSEWLCPLCDLHKKFDNPRVLEKHLVWDHSGVEVHWDNVRLVYPFKIDILWVIRIIPGSR